MKMNSILSYLLAVLLVAHSLLPALPTAASTHTYGPDDRLTDPAVSYDENGNLLDDGITAYTYDTAGRLVQTTTGPDTHTYAYDGRGNLVEINENGTATELVLNENTAHPTILGEIQGAVTRSYAYGMGMHAQKMGGAVAYPLVDHQGTIRHMTDAAGAVTHSRYYNAWGETRHTTGGSGPTLGYTGEREMADGTVYLRARAYQPRMGKMVQRDGIDPAFYGRGSQGHNRYSYVENNPVNYVDPSGHIACGGLCMALGIAAVTTVTGMLWAPGAALAPEFEADKRGQGEINLGNEAGSLLTDLAVDRFPDATIGRYIVGRADDAAKLADNVADMAADLSKKPVPELPSHYCPNPKWMAERNAAGGVSHYSTDPISKSDVSDLVDEIFDWNPNADVTIFSGPHGSGTGAISDAGNKFFQEDLVTNGWKPGVNVVPVNVGDDGADLYNKMNNMPGDCVFAWCNSRKTKDALDDFFERGIADLESLGLSDAADP